MGYYADYSGYLKFRKKPEESTIALLRECFEDIYFDEANMDMNIDGYQKYYEGDIICAVETITPCVEDGYIVFHGEDDHHWRFVFKNGTYAEENGEVVFETDRHVSKEDQPEFLGEIIDIFEDFLEEKGINIPNEDRPDEEGAASIYGIDYGRLSEELYKLMKGWNVLE